jgi:stage II sporulation protein D
LSNFNSIVHYAMVFGQTRFYRIINIILLICYIVLINSCSSISKMRAVTDKSKIPVVSVLIYKGQESVTLKSSNMFSIKDKMKPDRDISFNDSMVTFTRQDSLIAINDTTKKESIVSGAFELISNSENNRFTVNGNSYRGQLQVTVLDSELTVINLLDLESYIMGVVRNEIGKTSMEMIEAAKAQAVAARTYAVKNKGRYKNGYDFLSDVSDQVYLGASSETEVTNQAVTETSGEILEYNGKPVNALYFSSCGGITANAEDVWKGSDTVGYLKSVSNKIGGQSKCESSPHYRWSLKWTGEEIEQVIKANLAGVLKKTMPDEDFTKIQNQKLFNLAVLERDSSQRVKSMKIGFGKDSYIVTGEQARRILKGPSYILYSSLFRIDIERNTDGTIKTALCQGAGFGHGVGMCQWSARQMAQEGYAYQQILKFFYRGTSIKRYY